MYYDAWCFLKSMDDNIGNGIRLMVNGISVDDYRGRLIVYTYDSFGS